MIGPPVVFAHIDPTSGTIVTQVIAAGVFGALFTVRRWWADAAWPLRGLLAHVAGR